MILLACGLLVWLLVGMATAAYRHTRSSVGLRAGGDKPPEPPEPRTDGHDGPQPRPKPQSKRVKGD